METRGLRTEQQDAAGRDEGGGEAAGGEAVPRPSPALVAASGRDRDEWFAELDAWGAAGRPYQEIAAWLVDEQGLSRWWAQKLIVEYEQLRGLRAPGMRPDGTFTATASKAVAVPAEQLFEAVAQPTLRAGWLSDVLLRERAVRPGKSVRFDVDGGATRVNVTIITAGEGRSQIAVEHSHLPDPETAAATKARWRERLAALKEWIEASPAAAAAAHPASAGETGTAGAAR